MRHPVRFSMLTVASAVMTLLAACSGGGGTSSSSASASGLSGTVAVGAPMADATVRILDAAGNVVASGVAVDANGHFSGVTLTGSGPYRIEACGHAGDNYRCVYSVAQGNGVANVTPLTTAAVLLAANASPDTLMTGANSSLGTSQMNAAQGTLRTALSGVLSNAGVSGSFDFVSGDLSAGSRTGYDRVLDAVGVSTGEDTQPFVQITPRLGTGNVYLEANTSAVGSIAMDSASGGMNLAGLETLFKDMTSALHDLGSCTTNLPGLIDTNALMSMGSTPATGSSAVAAAFCQFIPSSDGPGWGVTLMSPTLGRCDFTNAANPVCRISFVIKQTDGLVQAVGGDMAVRMAGGGVWKFLGNAYPLELHAAATAQRDLVVDGSGAVLATNYARALAFDIQAYSGLGCAMVTQKDASANDVLVAYYKNFNPADTSIPRLSVWRNADGSVATNPASGSGRTVMNSDDTWIQITADAAGDNQVRNFFKGGREVTIALYSDTACTTPMVVGGSSTFQVDVSGVPPLSNKFATIPWPTLSTSSFNSIAALTLSGSQTTTLNLSWTFDHGYTGFGQASFCTARNCGQGSPSRIADQNFSQITPTVALHLTNGGTALAGSDFKMLALYGRDGDGLQIQSNLIYCTTGVLNGQCQ